MGFGKTTSNCAFQQRIAIFRNKFNYVFFKVPGKKERLFGSKNPTGEPYKWLALPT